MKGKLDTENNTFLKEGVEPGSFLLAQCLRDWKVCTPNCVGFHFVPGNYSPMGNPKAKVVLRCVVPHITFELESCDDAE